VFARRLGLRFAPFVGADWFWPVAWSFIGVVLLVAGGVMMPLLLLLLVAEVVSELLLLTFPCCWGESEEGKDMAIWYTEKNVQDKIQRIRFATCCCWWYWGRGYAITLRTPDEVLVRELGSSVYYFEKKGAEMRSRQGSRDSRRCPC
jgi:hypothetical protein